MSRVMRTALVIGCLAAASAVHAARAEEGAVSSNRLSKCSKAESLSIEGKAYIRYWYNVQDAEVEGQGSDEPHLNTFELWRFYFGVKAKLAPWLSARITSDVGPEKAHKTDEVESHAHTVAGENSYLLFLKYAWLEATVARNLYLRAGIVDNPYNSFTDDYWGYRYVFKNLGDEEKLWDSADLGAYLRFELPSRLGTLAMGVVNGSGYKNAVDNDAGKNFFFHAMLSPLAALGPAGEHLRIGGFANSSVIGVDNQDATTTWSAFAGWSDPIVTAGYQLVGRSLDPVGDNSSESGLGHALYLRLDTRWKVGALSRLVMWDADRTADDVAIKYQALAGLSWTPIPLFSVAASGVVTWWSEVAGGPETERDVTALLSTELSF